MFFVRLFNSFLLVFCLVFIAQIWARFSLSGSSIFVIPFNAFTICGWFTAFMFAAKLVCTALIIVLVLPPCPRCSTTYAIAPFDLLYTGAGLFASDLIPIGNEDEHKKEGIVALKGSLQQGI